MIDLFLSIFITLVDEETTIATTTNLSQGVLQSFNYEFVCKESIKVIYAA